MVTFKKYRELLNENYILLLEERIRNIVKVRLDDLVRNSTCYERHRKDISDYATNSKENLFIVFLFVIFTVQKNWPSVVDYFPAFLEAVFDSVVAKGDQNLDDAIKNAKASDVEEKQDLFKMISNNYKYIVPFWNNAEKIYNAVQELKDDPLTLYTWIVRNVAGLSAAKAGFYMQLIIGEFGCFDSVNIRLYGSKMGKLVNPKTGTISGAPTGDTDEAITKMVNYLRSYEEVMKSILGDDATKKMWDLWCSIVEHKIESARFSEKDNEIFKFSYKGDEFEGEIDPYFSTRKGTGVPFKAAKKAKESGRYKSKTGETVSGEHAGLLRHGFGKFGK
jgi:hypothetical protein